MNIKFSKNVEWLKPFIEGLELLVPIHRVSHVKGYKVKRGLTERAVASTIRCEKTKRYTINIKIKALVNKETEYRDEIIENLLIAVSHELAHIKEWKAKGKDHDEDHLQLEARILLHFAKKLNNNGIYNTSNTVKEAFSAK